MMTLNIDAMLIRQKDHILGLCNDGKYEEVLSLLKFSEELWAECSYAYKTREIRDRVRRAVQEELWNATHWKTKEKYENLLKTIPW